MPSRLPVRCTILLFALGICITRLPVFAFCTSGFYLRRNAGFKCTQCADDTFDGRGGACNGTQASCCTACPSFSSSLGLVAQSSCTCDLGYVASQRSPLVCQKAKSQTETCAAGFFSSGGSMSTIQCFPCPVGTRSSSGAIYCTSCTSGYYNAQQGQEVCKQCPAYSSSSSDDFSTCVCEQGKVPLSSYGSSASYTVIGDSLECATASSSYSSFLCPLGYTQSGSYDSIECGPCSQGKYSESRGQTSCQACPEDSYCPSTGASSASACLACPLNSQSPSGSNLCTCNNGFTSVISGSSLQCASNSQNCPPGSYTDMYKLLCAPCESGTIDTQKGKCLGSQASCCAGAPTSSYGFTCPTYSTTLGLPGQTACTCKAGYVPSTTNGDASSLAWCSPATSSSFCPPGHMQSQSGSYETLFCSPCLPGYYQSSGGAAKCLLCSSAGGHYNSLEGQPFCAGNVDSNCPPHSTSFSTDLTTCLCDKGYVPVGSASDGIFGQSLVGPSLGEFGCQAVSIAPFDKCPIGYSQAYSGTSILCKPCPYNHYQDTAGKNFCHACPANTFTTSTGASSSLACIKPAQTGALVLTTSTSSSTFSAAGESIAFTHVVSATTDTFVSNLHIWNTLTGVERCSPDSLTFGQQVTCASTYTTTAADVSAGYAANSAYARGIIASSNSMAISNFASVMVFTYTPSTTSTTSINCLSGFYLPPSTSICTPCDSGTIDARTVSGLQQGGTCKGSQNSCCFTCPSSSSTLDLPGQSACTCNKGKLPNLTTAGIPSSLSCTTSSVSSSTCPAGYFLAIGSFASPETAQCFPCGAGTTSSRSGQCYPCATGSYNANQAQSSCRLCSNTMSSSSDFSTCICSQGTVPIGSSSAYSGSVLIGDSLVGAASCAPSSSSLYDSCPQGYAQSAENGLSSISCLPCSLGTYQSPDTAGRAYCTACTSSKTATTGAASSYACFVPTTLQLSSTTSPTTFSSSGVSIAFTFTIVNQGTVSVTGLQIIINTLKNIGPISCASTALLAGAQTTCTATYTTTISDVLASRLLVCNVFASSTSTSTIPVTVFSNTFVTLVPFLASSSQQHTSNFAASSPLAMLGIVGIAAISIGGVWMYRNKSKMSAASSAARKLFAPLWRATRTKKQRARTMPTTTTKQNAKNVSFGGGGDIEESAMPLHDANTVVPAAQQPEKATKAKAHVPTSFSSRSKRAAQALAEAQQSLVRGERERRAVE